MATGRNNPCPCGSGKKYKKCCLNKSLEDDSVFLSRRLGQVTDELSGKIFTYIKKEYRQEVIHNAWETFINDPTALFDPESPQMPSFMIWLFYHWQPEEFEIETFGSNLSSGTVGQNFLDRHGSKLIAMEENIIREELREPYSFWEVMECSPGKSYTLRDILLDREFFMLEHSGSRHTKKHDILFGKCVTVDGVTFTSGAGHFIINPIYKINILNCREQLKENGIPITKKSLLKHHIELIDVFHTIEQMVFKPKHHLQNSDGEGFSFNKVIFDI